MREADGDNKYFQARQRKDLVAVLRIIMNHSRYAPLILLICCGKNKEEHSDKKRHSCTLQVKCCILHSSKPPFGALSSNFT